MSRSLIAPVSSRANVREALARLASPPAPQAPQILIKQPNRKRLINWPEYMWRELREGGALRRYLQRERHQTTARIRATGRHMQGFKQNNKSDFRLLSCVPAREYFRWKAVDPHFWEDDKNLKSLKRDNPEMQIFL